MKRSPNKLAETAAFVILAVAILLAQYSAEEDQGSCPDCNIILITIDALRADHLGLYGYSRDTSSGIDFLGRQSLVFENAYAHSPWTRTSMASMMTSRYPREHGVLTEAKNDFLDESFKTIPETFSENGYDTAAFITNSNLKSDFGFQQGFDHFEDRIINLRTEYVCKLALNWMKKRENKFFAWIHLNEPHDFYEPPGKYISLFIKPKDGYIHPRATSREWMTRHRMQDGRFNLTKTEIEWMKALYDGEIRYVDDELSRLLRELSESGILQNTILVITSDHGEEFLDHGYLYHGQNLHDELVKIPLLIKAPGIKPAKIEEPVGLVDVYPTLTAMAGISHETPTRGTNLLTPNISRIIYGETDFRTWHQSMIIQDNVKFIHDWESNSTRKYSLNQDPVEKEPEKPSETEKQKNIELIKSYRINVHEPAGKNTVSPETLEGLKNLGYMV